jgi:hypothetical protein
MKKKIPWTPEPGLCLGGPRQSEAAKKERRKAARKSPVKGPFRKYLGFQAQTLGFQGGLANVRQGEFACYD